MLAGISQTQCDPPFQTGLECPGAPLHRSVRSGISQHTEQTKKRYLRYPRHPQSMPREAGIEQLARLANPNNVDVVMSTTTSSSHLTRVSMRTLALNTGYNCSYNNKHKLNFCPCTWYMFCCFCYLPERCPECLTESEDTTLDIRHSECKANAA